MGKRTTDPALKVWLRPEEAAMYLGIGRTKMYTLIRDEIPPAKVGRTRRVRRTDLDRFMERRLADRR